MYSHKDFRAEFIQNIFFFIELAEKLPGVKRIAIIGSITTSKQKPKDVDLLVSIDDSIEIMKLATAARKLLGKQLAVGDSSGADVFLVNEVGTYLGRTCGYRECHPRLACTGRSCFLGSYVQDDFHIIRLKKELIDKPPVEIYPEVIIRNSIPFDLKKAIEIYQKKNETS